MLCTNYPTAHDLLVCAEEDAVLHVGEASQASVLFTNLATRRKTLIEGAITDGVLTIPQGEFIAGLTYLVQVVLDSAPTVPVPFAPYEVSGYSIVVGADTYLGVLVTFVKVDDVTATEQWLTL